MTEPRTPGSARLRTCNRFHEDGSACTNKTSNVDGWCREGCPGFVRRDLELGPVTTGAPWGTAKHIEETGALPVDTVALDEVSSVRVTTRALECFRFHHGGGQREAEVQLRVMLEDFLLKSAHRVSDEGFIFLARDGYVLTLSPKSDAITYYWTVHRERTWAQFKAGVPSRSKRKTRKKRNPKGLLREASGPAPAPGQQAALSDFISVFDPDTVHLTVRVRRSFAVIDDLVWAPDEELDAEIRRACAKFDASNVTQLESGNFEVQDHERTWLVSADCRSLIGVKRPTRAT